MNAAVTWRMRLLAAYAGLATLVTGRHVYLSTGCLHGDHGYCQALTGKIGLKAPASCKTCTVACICRCHHGDHR